MNRRHPLDAIYRPSRESDPTMTTHDDPEPTDRTVPLIAAERVESEHGPVFRVWCRFCDRHHDHAPVEGYTVANCYLPDSPFRQTGYRLVEAGPVRLPAQRYRPKYLRGGALVSGYLRSRQRELERRAAEVPSG